MKPRSSPDGKMPGSGRESFRQFFLGLGVALLLLPVFFYVRSPELPLPILVIVGGMGAVLLVIGLLLPAPKPLTVEEQQNRVIQAGEEVLYSGPANHLRGWENRTGRLNLTTQRLTFFSSGMNAQNADLIIPLTDIARVERAWTLFIIPNAFRVVTADGKRHQFTVFTPRKWIDAVQGACSASRG